MKKILLALLLLALLNVELVPAADWQTTLEDSFDIVETFDNLLDWTPSLAGGNFYYDDYPNDFPLKSDSSKSLWEFYSLWDVDSVSGPWISDHGRENMVWGSGKSMRMSDGELGPSRLGMYIGENDPSVGYKDVYVFFTIKYNYDFWPRDVDETITYFSYLKTFQASSGFRSVGNWGTLTEQGETDGSDQRDHDYGLNYTVSNFIEYNNGMSILFNPRTSNDQGSGIDDFNYHFDRPARDLFNGKADQEKWLIIEYRFKLSEPANTNTGVHSAWIYEKDGTCSDSFSYEDTLTFGDPFNNPTTLTFDHALNKFVWGGNHSNEFDGSVDRFAPHYLDDVILDSNRIGPKYFELLEEYAKSKFTVDITPFRTGHRMVLDRFPLDTMFIYDSLGGAELWSDSADQDTFNITGLCYGTETSIRIKQRNRTLDTTITVKTSDLNFPEITYSVNRGSGRSVWLILLSDPADSCYRKYVGEVTNQNIESYIISSSGDTTSYTLSGSLTHLGYGIHKFTLSSTETDTTGSILFYVDGDEIDRSRGIKVNIR